MKLLVKVWNLTRLRTKVTNSPKDCLRLLVLIHQRLPGKHYATEVTRWHLNSFGILQELFSADKFNMPTTSFYSTYCIVFIFYNFSGRILSEKQTAVEFFDNSGRNSIQRKHNNNMYEVLIHFLHFFLTQIRNEVGINIQCFEISLFENISI